MPKRGLTSRSQLIIALVAGLLGIAVMWVAYVRLPRWQFFLIFLALAALSGLAEAYFGGKERNGGE